MYLWVKCDEKSNSVAFQANLMKITMYDNYNVTTWPMKTVTTYPMVVLFFLLEVPVHQKPLHTRRY